MNFILMQFGYPPVIIKTEDKENYYAVLRLADVDEIEPFIEYIAQNLVRSLEIMIKGAKGESIEDPDDLDKKLALLDAKLQKGNKKAEKLKTEKLISQILDKSIKPLINDFLQRCKKLDHFYLDNSIYISIKSLSNFQTPQNLETTEIERIDGFIDQAFKEFGKDLYQIYLSYHYKHFNRINFREFSTTSTISVRFSKREYVVMTNNDDVKYLKHYLDLINEEEIQKIINSEIEKHISKIENKTTL